MTQLWNSLTKKKKLKLICSCPLSNFHDNLNSFMRGFHKFKSNIVYENCSKFPGCQLIDLWWRKPSKEPFFSLNFDHKFSIGLRSRRFTSHVRDFICLSWRKASIPFDLRQNILSSWKLFHHHQRNFLLVKWENYLWFLCIHIDS